MKYRLIDYYISRGFIGIDNDKVFTSELDIHEVAENLLKDRFQEMYDNWKNDNPDYFTLSDEPFLWCMTEFFNAVEMTSSKWFLTNGEECGRILLQENDPQFFYDSEALARSFNDNEALYENDEAYSFSIFTGIEPYGEGLWNTDFDPAKALLDAGIIKETV